MQKERKWQIGGAAQVTGKEQDRRDRGGVSGMLESELSESKGVLFAPVFFISVTEMEKYSRANKIRAPAIFDKARLRTQD